MHRALLLPEIVSAILEAGKSESGFLYHGLLVNHLWFQESSRIFWSICKSIDDTAQKHPDIHHLGALVLQNSNKTARAQLYASFVKEIAFHYGDDYTDQTSWHSVLCRLEFPNLRSVWLWETDHAALLNTEDVVLHYAQSALQTLIVDACSVLSETFFQSFAHVCSRVQYLKLHPDKVDASPASVSHMLENMGNVVDLDLGKSFRGKMTLPSLQAIASRPSLKLLTISEVQEEVFRDLGRVPGHDWFPGLEYLDVAANASALGLLHVLIPKLEALQLSNTHLGRTNDIVATASRFNHLTDISLLLSASSLVRSEELLQLAQACPGLERLKIGNDSWSDTKPLAVGFTDQFMQELAPKLPKLRQLSLLLCDGGDLPGNIKTIQILGRHCTLLEELSLSCRPDWPSMTDLPKDIPLANIENLTLVPAVHMGQCLTEEEFDQLSRLWQGSAASWLPRIDYINIHLADDREEKFVEVLCFNVGELDSVGEDAGVVSDRVG